jgi:hypothetical protein
MAKAPKLKDQAHIVTANHLTSGDVVYLTIRNDWSRDIAAAFVAPNAEAAAAWLAEAEAQAARNIVVAPYLVPVDASLTPPWPIQFRERIRAAGPTTEARPAA